MIFGSTGSNIPSRFLKEIPAELVREVAVDNGRSGTPGRSVFGSGVSPRERAAEPGSSRRPPPTTGAELLGLGVGDAVVHGKWGEGTVVETGGVGEDAEAVVVFPSVGRKKLLLRMAPIKRA